MEVEAVASVKRMIAAGNAFTSLPFPPVQQEIAEGTVAARPLENAYCTRSLVWRAGAPLSSAKRRLIALFIAEVECRLQDYSWTEMLPMARRRGAVA
jgi:DNA-binding transcriptional LysR family regulator